jgi:hypothetical protein
MLRGTGITGVGKNHRFLPRQQVDRLGHVSDVGSGGGDAMHQARFGIDADVDLGAKVTRSSGTGRPSGRSTPCSPIWSCVPLVAVGAWPAPQLSSPEFPGRWPPVHLGVGRSLGSHPAHSAQGARHHLSWESLRQQFSGQEHVTIALHRDDGQIYHLRKATGPEPHQQSLFNALNISHLRGKTRRPSSTPVSAPPQIM